MKSITYNSSQMHFIMLKERGTAPNSKCNIRRKAKRFVVNNGEVHYKKKNGTMVSTCIYMYRKQEDHNIQISLRLYFLLGHMHYTIEKIVCIFQVKYIIDRQGQKRIVIACHKDPTSGHGDQQNPSKNYRIIYMARCYKGCSRISKFFI